MSQGNSPTVFISYSHDSEPHRERVLALSERLRQDGIETRLDRYVNGAPAEGWPRWMLNQLDEAGFVLMICTETYYRRFRGHEVPGKGKGVDWEGALITQEIYDARSKTLRFVPVLLASADEPFIPEPLRGLTRYVPNSEADYTDLYDLLLGQSGVVPGPVGEAKRKERRKGRPLTFSEPDPGAAAPASRGLQSGHVSPSRLRHAADRLFGREAELAALDTAWNDPAVHVVTIVAWGGVGKTSLVAQWQAGLAARNYDGADYFDWTFYTQGSREQSAASADAFMASALAFFGDPAMASSPASPWDKGARLAQLVGSRRTLLVLDGIEPLQHPPGSQDGQLKDSALAALLKGLAQRNPGLCVVTTRERIADLAPFRATTAPEWQLTHLSTPAGVALLRQLCVQGAHAELEALVADVRGHALTLNLLGRYLAEAHAGDIRMRGLVEFGAADAEIQGGHAFRTMAAYEKWFADEGDRGDRPLAILRMLGLFDRPADAGCLGALRQAPVIPGLTDSLFTEQRGPPGRVKSGEAISDVDWSLAVARLASCGLVSLPQLPTSAPDYSLDAHPLVREYFASQLREKSLEAWRVGHSRLYEYLRDSTEEGDQPTLDDLQPLYQAVAHGCLSGRYADALRVLRGRLHRGDDYYTTYKLGAVGSDLQAVASFYGSFPVPSTVTDRLPIDCRVYLLRQGGYDLRAVGRLGEAMSDYHEALVLARKGGLWDEVALVGGLLGQAMLLHGDVGDACRQMEEAVNIARKHLPDGHRLRTNLTFLGLAYFEAGEVRKSRDAFDRATQTVQRRPDDPRQLIFGNAFRYLQLLVDQGDTATSLQLLEESGQVEETHPRKCRFTDGFRELGQAMIAVEQSRRTHQSGDALRARANQCFSSACAAFSAATREDFEATALIEWSSLLADMGATDLASRKLDEARQIAARGPMRLLMADVLLFRCRLFHAIKPYPWQSPQADLAAARKLIEECGYWRRKEELEDAEARLPTITNLEITLNRPVEGFDENEFRTSLRALLGTDAEKVRIVSVRRGSTVVGVEGESAVLGRMVDELSRSKEFMQEFMGRHGFTAVTWQEGGRAFELRVTGTLASAPSGVRLLPAGEWTDEAATDQPSGHRQHPTPATGRSAPMPAPAAIVLLTVNDNETHAVLDVFLGACRVPEHTTRGGITYNQLGTHGGMRIVHTICEMGASGIGAAQQRTRAAIDHWKPAAVIAVGLAFGLDETKQQIGDVLVATQIQDYELGRVNEDGTITPRGDRPGTSDSLRNRLRQTDATHKRVPADWPSVRFGLVLSGQKLVDSLDYRESLKALHPEAIGGEMEGVGLYASASEARVDWIVIKGICDWGHNKNQADKEAWQKLAAMNAARVLKSALDVGPLYPREQASYGGSNVRKEGARCADPNQEFPLRQSAHDAEQAFARTDAEAHGRPEQPPAGRPRLIRWTDELRIYGDKGLFKGRLAELALLDQALREGKTRVLSLWAEGGAGKTRLLFQWLNGVRDDGWRGVKAVFVHSFYSQGSRDSDSASSETFFDQALAFFGYVGDPIKDIRQRGITLAQFVASSGGLVVLDGLEPLQYPAHDERAGELKDGAVSAFLLALTNLPAGLCLVSTRQGLPELQARRGVAVTQQPLDRLDIADGIRLLRELEVKGPEAELRAAVEDYHGHAYSLMLLGTYLRAVTVDHDICRRYDSPLIDKKGEHDHHIEHIFQMYEMRLGADSRELAALRLLGFFDRPASRVWIDLLRTPKRRVHGLSASVERERKFRGLTPRAKGQRDATGDDHLEQRYAPDGLPCVTQPLLGLSPSQWQRVLTRLASLRLLSKAADGSLDSHPLLRQYYAEQLRTRHAEAWRAGHRRLYEYLRESTTEGDTPTLEGLQPLFQAVAHGCHAGMYAEALDDVYMNRLARWSRSGRRDGWHYSARVLGASNATLASLRGFFTEPWTKVVSQLQGDRHEFVLQQAGWLLRSTGRFSEAATVLEESRREAERTGNWHIAGVACRNLNQIYEVTGDTTRARQSGADAVRFAQQSGDTAEQIENTTRLAGTLHILGDLAEAERKFLEVGVCPSCSQASDSVKSGYEFFLLGDLLVNQGRYKEATQAADLALGAADRNRAAPIVTALANFVHGHAHLLRAHPPNREDIRKATQYFDACMEQLRVNGEVHQIPRGLLGRAQCHLIAGAFRDCAKDLDEAHDIAQRSGMRLWLAGFHLLRASLHAAQGNPGLALSDLDAAREIAENGSMRLVMADIHLSRARLGMTKDESPMTKEQVREELAKARKLIEECGYWRRREELEDAEEAAKSWPGGQPGA